MKEITPCEARNVLEYLADNNRRLADNGDTPISVCLEGEAGIGKTAVVGQLARDRGMTLVRINLAELQEPADLCGFPYREFAAVSRQDRSVRWVTPEQIPYMDHDTWELTEKSRMSYATPAWLPEKENPNGTICLLDDYGRANTLLQQCCMEIINTGSYISWHLPKYTSIILTTNPDNGEYNVNTLDKAQLSRMTCFRVRFDIGDWARWAEDNGIDGRAINFALMYSHELFDEKDHVTLANARTYTTFCRTIAGMREWDTEENLSMILTLASGCFPEHGDTIGTLFATFIHNRLDRLVTPEKMLHGDWNSAAADIRKCVYRDGQYAANIGSLLSTRFMNCCDRYLGSVPGSGKTVENRLGLLIEAEPALFTKDLLYVIVKYLCNRHNNITNKWFRNSTIREVIC